MAKNRGKKYQDALKKVDTKKAYAVNDAVQLVKDMTLLTLTLQSKLHST